MRTHATGQLFGTCLVRKFAYENSKNSRSAGRTAHDPSIVSQLGNKLHPRYGESALWVSSQCDVLTNESRLYG